MLQKRPRRTPRLRLPHVHRYRLAAVYEDPYGEGADIYRCRCGQHRDGM